MSGVFRGSTTDFKMKKKTGEIKGKKREKVIFKFMLSRQGQTNCSAEGVKGEGRAATPPPDFCIRP